MTRVVAGIIITGRSVLIAKRKKGGPFGGMWEFPGGKIEPGETPEECLERELFEELGIEAAVAGFIASSVHTYGEMTIELRAYRVAWAKGEFALKAHEEARWVDVAELKDYDFLPADIPIIRELEKGFK